MSKKIHVSCEVNAFCGDRRTVESKIGGAVRVKYER